MPSTGPRAKNWLFSVNNYTNGDLDRLHSLEEDVEFLAFFTRKADGCSRYLQGIVSFRSRKRTPQVISAIGGVHCTACTYPLKILEVIKKDGNFTVIGLEPMKKLRPVVALLTKHHSSQELQTNP